MSHPQHAAAPTSLVDRFLTAVRPAPKPEPADGDAPVRRQPKHKIDGEAYVSMLWRMVRALEVRAIDDPELLPQAVALAQRLDELVNVAIAANAERFNIDPRLGASAAECGRILGASKQAASQRRARGRVVMAARIAAAGAIPFAEARREREAIAAAAEHAVTYLADWRERRTA